MKRYELVQKILKECEQTEAVVTTYMANGFQMRGKVAMSDQFSFALTSGESNTVKLISYNQISTIDFPREIFFAKVNKKVQINPSVSPQEPFFIMREMFRECWETEKKVHLYMGNGFQMEGTVVCDDDFSFVLLPESESNKVARLIFFTQLSTIDFPFSVLKSFNDHHEITPTQEKND